MTHTIQAVAWTLIHFCWQAAAVAAVYAVAARSLARRSSNVRYVAALAALLAMLAASAVTFAWEMRSGSRVHATAFGAAAPGAAASDAHAGYKISPILTPASDPLEIPATSPPLASMLPWIDGFWLIGVIVLSCRSLGGWWLIQRLRKAATIEAPAAALASFERIGAALGLRRPAMLRISRSISGPMTVGVLRALVLLPLSAATSLSPEELEVVLAHELAHVRRADFFWNLVQTFAETLFFFHPAVWWIGNRLRHERELCCDDLALSVCPDPLVYARALYRLEEERGCNWKLAMALDGHQPVQTLRMRIARILGEPFTHTASRGPFSIAAAGALLVVLMLPVPQVLADLNPARAAAQAPSGLESPAAVPNPLPAPHAHVAALSSGIALPAPQPMLQQPAAEPAQSAPATSERKGDYIDQMKAAGYDVDLDKMIAMKIQDVTPEYAAKMAQIGFGKLTADQLIACKIQDVTPEYITEIKSAGYDVGVDKIIAMKIQDVTPEYAAKMAQIGFGKLSADDLIATKIQDVTPEYIAQIKSAGYDVGMDKIIAMKIQDVTPEYAAKMAQIGFGKLSADDLIATRIQDVTPEYIAQLKHDGLEVKTVQDAIQYRIFNVTPEFVTQMKSAGFGDLTHDQLMALRVQGVTPEYATSIRQQYPGATVEDIVKTKIFNINADFIASAKRHGFTDLTLEKLVKLRISGILDDGSDSK
jgi:beta-lactamase regulating signal transducer with metallopeptidase domain